MKKLLLGFAIAVAGLSGTSASVGATDSCTISNTGPDSTNSCVVKEDFTCEVKNDNKFTVINNNDQEATSGDATVSGNTSGGGATSGSATNSNGTVIDVTITNGGCVVTAVTPPAPVVPVGGSGGGQPVGGSGSAPVRPVGGMGAVAPVAAPRGGGGAAPAVLPETSTEATLGIAAGLVTLLAAVVLGSRTALGAYGKLHS